MQNQKPVLKPKQSNEYLNYIKSAEWSIKSKACKASTGQRCTLLWWKKANDSHHLTYKNLKNEKNGRDIIPLSREAHNFVHCKLLWGVKMKRHGKRDPRISPLRPTMNFILRCLYCLCVVWFKGIIPFTFGISLGLKTVR